MLHPNAWIYRTSRWLGITLAAASLAVFAATATARPADGPCQAEKQLNVAAKMRDGVTLRADIYRPRADGKFPVLLERTPYDKSGGRDFGMRGAARGYVVVIQDTRGRYASEGEWYTFKNESNDGFDSVEWAAALPYADGKVGMFGGSYVGATQFLAAIAHPPHLAGIAPNVTASNYHDGWTYQGGAFEQWFNQSWASGLSEDTLRRASDRITTPLEWKKTLPLAEYAMRGVPAAKSLAPYYADWLAHPNYDEFWQKQAVTPYLDTPKVPNLNVAGWWDQEDFYGPMKIYETLEKKDANHMNYVVAGPWNHGGWSRGEGRKLGDIDFDSDTAQYFREKVQAPWFAYWLKDKGPLKQPEALTFQTGSNRWESYDEWPPRSRTNDRPLYFQRAGMASFAKPEGDT